MNAVRRTKLGIIMARQKRLHSVCCHLYEIFRIRKSTETHKADWRLPGAGARVNGELLLTGYGIFFRTDENILEPGNR